MGWPDPYSREDLLRKARGTDASLEAAGPAGERSPWTSQVQVVLKIPSCQPRA